MNELTKLTEAKYFYDRMLAEFNNRENFVHNLHAFLSPARSVLLYACKEAKTKTGGQQWYQEQMDKSSILRFFREKRNWDIHEHPVKPVQHTEITLTSTIGLSPSLRHVHCDKNGNVLGESPPEITEPKPRKPEPPPVVTTQYKFTDWPGSEDLMTLSKMYLDELHQVVEDGISKSFLTG